MRIGKWLLNGAAAVMTAAALGSAAWYSTLKLPSFEEVKGRHRSSDSLVVDRDGEVLGSTRSAHSARSLHWVAWSDVSPAFQSALIKAEDRRFYTHPGVDVLALGRAGLQWLSGRGQRGASTITMQLASLIDVSAKRGRRTPLEKLRQIARALHLERAWSKEQIVEAYVNLVSFRGELIGLPATAAGYFKKSPGSLHAEESALLTALLRAPNARPDRLASRACALDTTLDCAQLSRLAHDVFGRPYEIPLSKATLPVISKHFLKPGGDGVLETTLDRGLQSLAMAALQEQLKILSKQNVRDGAVLVLDNKTGEVLAYAANPGAGVSSAHLVDGIQAPRQAGSTLKPFVYGAALELGILQPGSLLDDSPADVPVGQGRVYHPRNYDNQFRGLVTVSEALGSSLNVPAVRALRLVGERRVLALLRDLGFSNLKDEDYYGPSLALGSADVSLWELTQAYRRLAREDAPLGARTRGELFEILSAPQNRRHTFGAESVLNLPFKAAVKTGTSKDMRDNWCLGYTSAYTVGVWVGNFSGEAMWNVSGVSGAAPVWRHVMLALHRESQPAVPAAEAAMKFEPERQVAGEPLPARTLTRIAYPLQDMLVALDPDIPPRLQKLPIEIEAPQEGHTLFINGKRLGSARELTLWPLKRGRHKIELRDRANSQVDQIPFVVR
ncbi:MAG TPA: penicillin-binding protein 1C [Bdellovibrionales bacterium]|nr:penicillin-binding protein 1C [Bdellovibrionales bacterium]